MKIIYNKEEAVDLLLQQKLVVIFQGHSEWGARALGNRSMLFDPRNVNAKEIVNKIKGRQWWRPTAATILYEHRHDYLKMHTLDESPYMTFAIDAKQKAMLKRKKLLLNTLSILDSPSLLVVCIRLSF